MNRLTSSVAMLAIGIFLAGCGPGQLLGPTVTPTPSSTSTPTSTNTPAPTSTPRPTSTNTPTPTATERAVLTVEGVFTFNTGPSSQLAKGEQGYAEGDVYEEGRLGQAPIIGEFMGSYTSIDGFGTGASIGYFVWRIFGEGDIYVAREFVRARSPEFQGTIIGGTGRFAAASGEYSAILTSCCNPVVLRASFVFDAPIRFGN